MAGLGVAANDQSWDKFKVSVGVYDGDVVLNANRGNPEVICRNRRTLSSQIAANTRVILGGVEFNRQHPTVHDELVNSFEILVDSIRIERTESKFANHRYREIANGILGYKGTRR